jgi:uncharacterized membrane protein
MVETSTDTNTGLSTIVLRPNNSASWQFNMVIVSSLAFIAFCISTFFALQGFWLIFPFTGLEVSALLICLYLRLRANTRIEVITFDKSTVIVEHGCYHAEKSWRYHRLWAKILVKRPGTRGRQKQIFIRSHGKELELGSFLNKQDKDILVQNLKSVIYT